MERPFSSLRFSNSQAVRGIHLLPFNQWFTARTETHNKSAAFFVFRWLSLRTCLRASGVIYILLVGSIIPYFRTLFCGNDQRAYCYLQENYKRVNFH